MPQAPSPQNPPTARDNVATLYTTDRASVVDNLVRYDFASDIDETLWNKAFPYQLAVLEASLPALDLSTGQQTDQVTYGFHEESLIFTLPINPEALTNSMPFAISVSATLGGVVEQHGGAPFRQIMFQGTMGVVTDRPTATTTQNAGLGGIGGIFAGTVQAIRGATTEASSSGAGERFTSNLTNEVPGDGTSDIAKRSTGYYQFRQLQRFLESYVELKKTADGANLRLALFVWKEQAAYLVTPQSFDVTRSAQNPYEYRYSLRLQAWKRIDPNSVVTAAPGAVFASMTSASGFTLAKVFALISTAIRVAKAVKNVLKAIRKDIAKIVDVLRKVALFCAAVAGIVKTALSLPSSIRKDFESATRESWNIVKGSFDGLSPTTKSKVDAVTAEVDAFRSGNTTSTPTLQATLADDDQTDFHDLITPDSLNLPQRVRDVLDRHVQDTLTMTSHDFREAADMAFSLVADYADAVGLNDPTYDLVTGRTARARLRDATMDDFRAMHALVTAASAIQSLVVNAPSRIPITTIEYVAGLANLNGITQRVPKSKFAVPFPYGISLERLSQQYLGDATRWMEIAELNDLRAPYVDEVGTTQALVTNGNGNILNLVDASALTLGQFVSVWSDRVIPEKRRVVTLRQISTVQWQVTVDGDNDLAKLKIADHASIQWFTVGTVNSQQVIYIPSDSPANPDILRYVPQEEDFNRILDQGDVDGALTDTGDLVITPDGDWPIVFGYAALIQWARVALNTPIKSLSLHPDFGLDSEIGQSLAESSAADILKSVQTTFRFNPSFAGVTSALIQRNGPTTQVSLELGIRGVSALLPLTFSVVN